MQEFAKLLILIGGVMIVLGTAVLIFDKTPFIGKLPGDIMIKRGNFSFYFPITTCIVISMIISFIMMMVRRH